MANQDAAAEVKFLEREQVQINLSKVPGLRTAGDFPARAAEIAKGRIKAIDRADKTATVECAESVLKRPAETPFEGLCKATPYTYHKIPLSALTRLDDTEADRLDERHEKDIARANARKPAIAQLLPLFDAKFHPGDAFVAEAVSMLEHSNQQPTPPIQHSVHGAAPLSEPGVAQAFPKGGSQWITLQNGLNAVKLRQESASHSICESTRERATRTSERKRHDEIEAD